jgi:2-polyprenyl-3-methyl-5-hydroxy-6-metoxy-1,4-benzoquinol methylase
MQNGQPQEFKKYAEQGAYHWLSLQRSWKTSFNPYLAARYKVAIDALPKPATEDEMAIDLGCGDGYFSYQLRKRGYQVQAVDGQLSAIKLAQQKTAAESGIEFQVGNVLSTPFSDNSADVVTSLDVIEHLDDPETHLREIKRLLKKGGVALIGTPIRITEHPLDKYHVQEFFPEEFGRLLSKTFSNVQLKSTHPIEYLALMRKKTNFFGRKKNLWWNIINLQIMVTGKNPLESEGEFPTYQFAVCRN